MARRNQNSEELKRAKEFLQGVSGNQNPEDRVDIAEGIRQNRSALDEYIAELRRTGEDDLADYGSSEIERLGSAKRVLYNDHRTKDASCIASFHLTGTAKESFTVPSAGKYAKAVGYVAAIAMVAITLYCGYKAKIYIEKFGEEYVAGIEKMFSGEK